ncbi:ISL3 family transposase [Arachidicoccus soli]|uniref:ISL3 family transposase n=1 Tax=Arachidicoccus soli TaxID=2341117 RepID=A0A386HN50_9BACT|nr:ISL3 family transposase [Arachidicoccus soli]AYD47059.1 ISL3 family transposase [Arachidicoccus soli]
MESKDIFGLALNLSEPWEISEMKLTKLEGLKRGQLDIYIDFVSGSEFRDSDGQLCGVYDSEERSWQHLNFFEHTCYLHARVPRIKQADGKVKTVPVPWARSGSGFTLLFEAFAMLLIEYEMPVNKVASTLRVVPNRLWRVFNHWVEDGVKKDDLSSVTQIGIDDTSSRKGHKYVTVNVDLATRRVIHVCEDRGIEAVAELADVLTSKAGDPEKVDNVAIDMSPSYISGVQRYLPKAQIVFDKFHVVAKLGEAMDELRKQESRGNEQLKGHKYTILKNYKNLSSEKREELDFLLMMYPRLGEAYRLKVMFKEFWDFTNTQEAMAYLSFWCDIVDETDIFPFKRFVKTVKTHWSGIMNYVKARINSGVMEGINNKIQLAKRRARGFRNKTNFINMIYFIAGKMKFDYPYYPL